MNENAVCVESLDYSYGERAVLRGLSFSVRPGEIFGLLGPNGSGKTTTFRVLTTFFPVRAGHVSIFGSDPASDAAAVRAMIGVVFQQPSLDKRLTVSENLIHHGRLYGLSGGELRRRAADGLAAAGLSDRAGELVLKLSGGLARRVELAKGLLHRPKLLILDEPSTGLDPGARSDLWRTLGELKAAGTTILLTTHWMEEAERCDRLAVLHEGRIVASGSPDELKREIGGDVIELESGDAEALAKEIQGRLSVDASALDGKVRIEVSHGHAFVAKLFEAFPGRIQGLTLRKPTLEDVFIRKTGHRFWREKDA